MTNGVSDYKPLDPEAVGNRPTAFFCRTSVTRPG